MDKTPKIEELPDGYDIAVIALKDLRDCKQMPPWYMLPFRGHIKRKIRKEIQLVIDFLEEAKECYIPKKL